MWTSSSSLGCAAVPVRSGPTFPPSPEWVWHFAHCCVKTALPCAGIAPFQNDRGQGVDDLLAVGIGQAAPLAHEVLGASGDRLVRVIDQGLLLVERQLGQPDLALLDAVHQRDGPVRPPQQNPQGHRAHGGGERAERIDEQRADLGGLAPADRLDQPDGQLRRDLRRDDVQKFPRGLRVRAAELDHPTGRLDPGGFGLRVIAGGGQERRADLGHVAVEARRAPATGERDDPALARQGQVLHELDKRL